MTTRDRTVAAVLVAVALVAAYWFLLLGPKRSEAAKLKSEVADQKTALSSALSQVSGALQAKADYASNYATVARLGQAVPADDSVPSLVFQLESAAKAAGVEFRGVKLEPDSTAAAPVPAPAPAPSSGSSSSSGSSATSGSSSSTTTTPSSDSSSSSGSTPPASGSASSSGSSSSTSTTPSSDSSSSSGSTPPASGSSSTSAATSTAASASAAAGLPPGASVGPAGFPTMPFTLEFKGSFFHMSDFLRRVDRFVHAGGKVVRVEGRLLTIDGVALEPAPSGFPAMTATLAVNAYLIPPGQDATGGASPTAPAGASTTESAGSTASPSAPATAAVTSTP